MAIKTYIKQIKKEERLGAYCTNLLASHEPVDIIYGGTYLGYIFYELMHNKTGHIYLNQYQTLFEDKQLMKINSEKPVLIIKKSYKDTLALIKHIDQLMDNKPTLKIALDGYASAGKTSLSMLLKNMFDMVVIHTDDFFKKPEIDKQDPLSKYGANIDFELINQTVIKPFLNKSSISYSPFDFKSHKHLDKVVLSHKPMILIEGAFATHPKLDIIYDLKVFYSINYFKQLKRLRQRGTKTLLMFMRRWIPNERAYNKALKVKKQADLIIKS